jgi:hypothetical protein
MKKDESGEMRDEYSREDLGEGVRGKYYDDFKSGTNLVLLAPDVAAVFKTEEAVNKALRELIDLARRSAEPEKGSKPKK